MSIAARKRVRAGVRRTAKRSRKKGEHVIPDLDFNPCNPCRGYFCLLSEEIMEIKQTSERFPGEDRRWNVDCKMRSSTCRRHGAGNRHSPKRGWSVKRKPHELPPREHRSYIHRGKLGVLVEVNCETDFAARSAEFQGLVKDIAMHIAAQSPLYVRREDVPAEVLEKEKEIYKEQARGSGKPEHIIDKIAEGKLESFYEMACLYDQKFVDPAISVKGSDP
jgi:hypothetical protein